MRNQSQFNFYFNQEKFNINIQYKVMGTGIDNMNVIKYITKYVNCSNQNFKNLDTPIL